MDMQRLSQALKAAHAAGDTAAATKLAQEIRRLQQQSQTPAKPTGDTSMGTAFKVGDAGAVSASQAGMASLNRNLDNSFMGKAYRYLGENIANPVREAIGKEALDYNQVLADEQARLDKAANVSAEYLEQLQKDLNFQNLETSDIKDLGSFVNYVAQKGAQAAPYMGAILASGGSLTYPFMVGEVSQSLDEIEGLSQAEKDDIAAVGGAVMAALENLGIGKLLPKGTSNKIIGGIAKGLITEGTTEGMQELVLIGSEAVAGKQFGEGEILNRLKESAAAGAVVGGSFKGAINTGAKVKTVFTKDNKLVDLNDLSSSEKQAGADVARLLRVLSEAEGYNLRDTNVSSDKGGKRALEAARRKIIERLRVLKGDEAVKRFLSPKERDSFDQLIDDFAPAGGAFRAANNKVSDRVTQEQYDAVMRLLPESKEKQEIANLLRMSNQVTDLFNRGLKGGISQYTDHFNPFIKDGSYDPSRLTNLALGFGSALALGAPTTAAIVGGGRTADFVTGRRAAAVDRFVRSNENKEGLPQPEGESLIEQQALREQEDADADAELATVPQDELDTSPIGTILNGTGLGQRGLEIVLNELETTYPDNKSLQKSIESTRKNLAGGNNKIFKSTRLVGILNRHINDNPDLQSLREALPDRLLSQRGINVQTDMPTMGGGGANTDTSPQFGTPQFTTQENYNRGIEANREAAQTLSLQAQNDPELDLKDKAVVASALDQLQFNLGSEPTINAQAIFDQAKENINEDVAVKYIKPYVDRVVRQQRSNPVQAAAEAGVAPEFDTSGLSEKDARLINMTDEEIAADVEAFEKKLTEIFGKFGNKKPRLSMEPSILQQPEIPRGETTNIQMPNTLGSAFEFAKNSNFRTGRDFKLELQEKALKAQQEEGIDLSELSEENSNRLADYVVADALEALKNNANAIGWYDRTVTDALNTLGEVYPEILTNPTNKLQFIWALAVTSNGTKVDKNFELAATAYDTLQRTGRFPTDIGIGDAARAINSGLAQYHTMLDKFNGDHGQLEAFMNSQQPVRDLEKTYDVDISGEGKDTLVRGASILGAKIGNGFFSNLYGNFDALTMDRWLMRTVGRHRGTLIKINQPMIKKKQGEIKSIFTNADPSQMKALRNYLKPSGIKMGKNMSKQSINELAAYIAHKSTSKPWREGLNAISNDLRKSANGLAGYRDGQVEMPAGAKERNFIRSVFSQALDRLNADPAVSRVSNAGLTMSDLQALLWYPEKRLYDSSKAPEGEESRGYKDDEAPDYANAARKLVEARKAVAGQSGLGSSGAAGDGRRGATSPNARLSQQPTGSAGILFRNASQSAASRRPRSDDRNIVPNTSEVKQAAKPVKALIEIGSPNGEFPDGIKDIEGVRRLAEATNITIDMYTNQDDMIRKMGLDPNEVRALGGYADGIAYVLAEGSDRKTESGDTIGFISKFDEYIAALHEVFHGVNDQLYNPEVLANMDSETRARMEGRIAQGRDMGKNKVTGRKEIVSSASFDSFIAGLTTGKTKVPNDLRKKTLAEMLDLQKNGYFRSQRGSVREIRNRRAMETNPDYKKYVRNAPETAVDVIMYYAHDPKRMKREYPNLAKMVKAFFSQSSKVQFFSHPLAMAIAVVYAMLLKQEQAEEEDQQRGILAQQQAMQAGALTA